jgi:hypothetical protein
MTEHKFPQLAVGQRFEYEGKVYVKVGPLTARAMDGSRDWMIPRYALVKPVGGAPPEIDHRARYRDTVDAFDVFYGHCLRLLEEAIAQWPEERSRHARENLAAARQAFLDRLSR